MSHGALAPIAIFAYRRTRHLAQTLDALERCPEFAESPVFVFSDDAKTAAAKPDVTAVRALLRARAQPNITVIEATENNGLASSIITGVTELCDRFGRVIAIEDDLLVAPCTLAWFNQALDAYASAEQIFHINAYQHDVPEFRNRHEGMFCYFVGSWGWATWKRAWQKFDPYAAGWEQLIGDASLRHSFNQNGTFPLSDMLIGQMQGRSDSWAIRWFWTVFKSGAMALSPPRSLIRNIGFDSSGTHNNIGSLKRFLAPKQSLDWESLNPPLLPPLRAVEQADECAHQGALLRTGAMRNTRIKNIFRKVVLQTSRVAFSENPDDR